MQLFLGKYPKEVEPQQEQINDIVIYKKYRILVQFYW